MGTIRLLTAALLLAAVPGPGRALERSAHRPPNLDRPGSDEWARGCTQSIIYYNYCTGWIWAWSGWDAGERTGISHVTTYCNDNYLLASSWHYASEGTPSGYGFTGTMELAVATSDRCPTSVTLAVRPILPVAGWNHLYWATHLPGGPPGWLLLWRNGPVAGNPTSWATDHPAAGPTGPPACGTCYPETRETRSFRFGTPSSPACPGLPYEDGSGCTAELLWDVEGGFVEWGTPVAVEAESWAGVKTMYR